MSEVRTSSLELMKRAIDMVSDLEGQDQTLTVEMSCQMLTDLIENGDLAPMIIYVTQYVDVMDDDTNRMELAFDMETVPVK